MAQERELGGFKPMMDGWTIELFYKIVWKQGLRE
jgi:hypothetical protein